MVDLPAPNFPVYDVPVQIVQGLLAEMDSSVQEFTSLAEGAIGALENLVTPAIPDPPAYGVGTVTPPAPPTIAPPNPTLFGTVSPWSPVTFDGIDPTIASLASQLLSDVANVPKFTPDVGAPNIPDSPGNPTLPTLPSQPIIDDVAIPAAPNLNDPGPGTLIPYTIPDIPTITLPVFDVTVPTFDDEPPSAILSWTEPVYQPLVRDQLATTITGMLAGDFAMPDSVWIALVGASRDRELMTTRKVVNEAMRQWASRGFEMPPGMVNEDVSAAQQDGALRENDRTRDIVQKRGDWANQNLREAVTQGIQLESQLMSYFNSFAARTLDAAKFTVDSQRLLFDSKVALYRATNEQLNILCNVFETQLKAALSPLEVMKAELENQQLIGTLNEQTLRVYQTRVQALGLLAQQFQTLMEGAKVQSDIQKNKVDIWRAQIDGFTAQLNAAKIPYEIYDIRVRGEATKATALEAEARAFAATVEGFTAGENVKIAVLNGELRAIDSATQRYIAQVNTQRDIVSAQADAIRAEAGAYSADVGRVAEYIRYATSQMQVQVQSQESNVRNNLAYYDAKTREYDAMAQRIIAISNINLEGIKAAGSIASQLAAGAMSARHVQASISGSGSASTSSGYSYQEQHYFDDTQ